jgi:mannan endo-1,4-beta-mannosidase
MESPIENPMEDFLSEETTDETTPAEMQETSAEMPEESAEDMSAQTEFPPARIAKRPVRRNKWLLLAAVILLVLAVVLLIFTRRKPNTSEEIPVETETTAQGTTVLTEQPSVTESADDDTAPSYDVVPLDVPPVNPEDTDLRIEAEDALFTGLLEVEDLRSGYSGDGYLAGFSLNPADSVQATFTIPAAQHYDITISVCADTVVTNALLLNGEEIGQFTIEESGNFVRVTFSGIYLPEGEAVLSIEEIDGYFSLDYFEITNYEEMYDMDYRESYSLSDKNASEGAQALMTYLSENYGQRVITGQYASDASNTELSMIYHLTGKYPAIRFDDVEGLTANSTADSSDAVSASAKWADMGGIVGLMWHWDAPMGVSSVYAEETDFSLANAVTEEDVACLDNDALEALYEEGAISEECMAILRDIDSVSEALAPLAEQDIPVLWRPLQEASGDWFWWGAAGPEAYRWLWEVMYLRMTEYHGLHNLIWIWNGQSEEYLVDSSLYDIASLDIYLAQDKTFGSRYEQFVSLSRMTEGEKILALSECSTVPDMNLMFRDNCIWSFFGLWYGEYLIDEDGRYATDYTSAEDMIAVYNSEAAITLSDTKAVFGQ